MNDLRVLISGDYWHQEFKDIVSGLPSPVTLAPMDRLDSILDQHYDLIVLAQVRPDQIPAHVVEEIQAKQPTVPVVALLGSWCEGGMRSDVPWPGVRRVYWHQWSGRFEKFSKQLAEDGITLWHQSRTASDADDALHESACEETESKMLVAVSAVEQTQFDYLRDVLESFGWQACWAERASFDAETLELISAVCIDANSYSEALADRIEWLQDQFAETPKSLILNFPRSQDVAAASSHGIHDLVSKPFQPHDLKNAIEASIKRLVVAGSGDRKIPSPHRATLVSRSTN